MAATSVGQIGLDLVVNKNGFDKQMSGIQSLAKKAAAALAGAFAVKKIVEFGKSCLDLGSDLAEVQNVVDVTFPSMKAQVDEFAKSAINSSGLSETMAKQFTGTFGAMAKSFGFTEKQAYDMGAALTGLAGDVASFYNISQDEAYTKLKSVFTGETESLKDLGVVMTQTALDSYAMANGFGKTTQAMSESEKVALRYSFVQDKLAAAQGDFARTSGSWANQVRILKLQFDSLKATIGQGLINLFTPIIKTVNTLLGKLGTLANAFKAFTELLTGNKSSGSSGERIAGMGAAAADAGAGMENASGAADDMASSASKAGSAAKKAAKEMRTLMGFDKINKLSDQTEDSGSGDSGSESGRGSSAGGIGSSVNFGSLASGETVIDQVDSKFTGLLENIKKLCEPATQSLKRLYNEGLAKLGNFAWTALKDFYHGFLVPVGKWTLGTGIPRFVDALNNGLNKVNWSNINGSLRKLWDALAPFAIKVGEGLLWFWENVLVPLGTWTANEVVPRFLDTLSSAIKILNEILSALQPLFQWFWDSVLLPIAKWTGGVFLTVWDGINGALQKFSDWCVSNPGTIQGITIAVGAFFASWKATELLSFIEQSGGITAALGRIASALLGTTAAKIADKAETIALNALYAKDFVISIGQAAAALIKQAAQFTINTAAKIADTAAQVAMTAATVAWNGVCALATTATTALGAAFNFLTSPIGLVIIAISAVVAAGVLVYKNWDTIKAKAIEIWGAIKDWFKSTCTAIGEFLSGLWKGIKETFANVGTWFTEKFEAAKDGVHTAFETIGGWFGEKYKAVTDAFKNAGTWFKTKFDTAYKNATDAFKNAGTYFGDIWSSIKKSFGNITEWFRTKFSNAWQAVKKVFSSGGEVFAGIKDGILGSLKSVVNGLISGINSVVAIPFNGINSALGSLRNWSVKIGPYELARPFSWLPYIGTPHIPYLAQGGFVEKNTPQLAMIGDNRHQGEIVAPEDKLQKMAERAAQAAGNGGVSKAELEQMINNAVMRIVSALSSLAFYIDSEELARAVLAGLESVDGRYNPVKIT